MFAICKILIVGPPAPESRGLGGAPGAQGSLPVPTTAVVGDPKGSRVARSSVGLGNGVELGTGVGGTGVADGTAACVRTIIVPATAIAEAWTCPGSIVGAA